MAGPKTRLDIQDSDHEDEHLVTTKDQLLPTRLDDQKEQKEAENLRVTIDRKFLTETITLLIPLVQSWVGPTTSTPTKKIIGDRERELTCILCTCCIFVVAIVLILAGFLIAYLSKQTG